MPIYETGTSKILHFGHGDIGVVIGRSTDLPTETDNELIFFSQEARLIGDPSEQHGGETSEDVLCPVRMIFDTPDSIDVLMGQLNELRDRITTPPTKCKGDCCCGCNMKTCACQDGKIETDPDGTRWYVSENGFAMARPLGKETPTEATV